MTEIRCRLVDRTLYTCSQNELQFVQIINKPTAAKRCTCTASTTAGKHVQRSVPHGMAPTALVELQLRSRETGHAKICQERSTVHLRPSNSALTHTLW